MSRYTASIIRQERYTVVRLNDAQSDTVAEIVPDIGNNLYRFESRGRQVIMPPVSLESLQEEAFGSYKCGIPILSPPNRVKNGSFTFRGRTYRLPLNEPPHHHLHGEIGAKRWDIVDTGAADDIGAYVTCRFRYASYPEIMTYFSHPLSFVVTYRLSEGRLEMEGTVSNESADDEAPFAFGLHPYFALPYATGEPIVLSVPAAAEWPVTEEAFVTGEPRVTAFSRNVSMGGVRIDDYPRLGCSLVELSETDRTCRLTMPDSGYTIAYRVGTPFRFAVLFRPDWSSAFSIEPYTCVTDAFNAPYASLSTGARGIGPNEEISFATSIWIEEISVN